MNARTIYSADPRRGWQPWGIFVPFLGFAFIVASVGSLTVLLHAIGLVDANENPVGLAGFAAYLLLPFAMLGLVVLLWVRFVERRSFATIGLVDRERTLTFARGHLTAVAMVSTVVAAIWGAGAYRASALLQAIHSPAGLSNALILLVCIAVQSSVEEIVFRGWMLSAISAKFGSAIAIILTSLVFTFLHYEPRASGIFIVNVFIFAVFAACWAIRSGQIWSVMGWHSGWNWLLATGFGLRMTGLDAHTPVLLVRMTYAGPDYLTGGAEGPEGSLACTSVLIAGIIFLALSARRRAPAGALQT